MAVQGDEASALENPMRLGKVDSHLVFKWQFLLQEIFMARSCNLGRVLLAGASVLAGLSGVGSASASSFTRGSLPSAVTEVGGVVLGLTGLNGNRVITQAAASSLFVGSPSAGSYPLLFGSQGGFTSAILSALGGGLSNASVRVSLSDGDSQLGNFDYQQNTLYIGTSFLTGANLGDFSNVTTQQTDGLGNAIGSTTAGFGDDILDTGFFNTNSAPTLAVLYDNLTGAASGSGVLNFYVNDLSPGDQFYDFTQGLDGSVINVGTGPIVTPPMSPVPLPASLPMFAAAILVLGTVGFRLKRKTGATA